MPSLITTVRTFTMPKSLNESLAVSEPGSSQPASQGGMSLAGAKKVDDSFSKDQRDITSDQPKQGITFAAQEKLPKLPIPELDGSMRKYLAALKPLQSPREHVETQNAVEYFLKNEGPELQERLKNYATGKTSYIEQFCRYFHLNKQPRLTYVRVRFLFEL